MNRPTTSTAYVFLGISLLITLLCLGFSLKITSELEPVNFTSKTERLVTGLQTRLNRNINIIQGFVGLFHASTDVNPKEFQTYFDSLNTLDILPSLEGIGYLGISSASGQITQNLSIPQNSLPIQKLDINHPLIKSSRLINNIYMDQTGLLSHPIIKNEILIGYLVAKIDLKKLFEREILSHIYSKELDIEIFRNSNLTKSDLVYDSQPQIDGLATHKNTLLVKTVHIPGGDFTVTATNPLPYPWLNKFPLFVLVSGIAGSTIGFFMVLRSIKKSLSYEAHIQHINSELVKFKSAVEGAYNQIVITNPEGKITYANPATEKLTGFGIAEILGNTPRLWGKQMPPEFYKDMWHTIKDLKLPFYGEIKNKRKNGELYHCVLSISPLIDVMATCMASLVLSQTPVISPKPKTI